MQFIDNVCILYLLCKSVTHYMKPVSVFVKYVEFFLNIARLSLRLSTLIKMAARANNYATPWLPARQGRFHN